MGDTDREPLTRRAALKALAVLAGAALAENCGGGAESAVTTPVTPTPPAPPTPTPTYPVTGNWITPVFLTEAASGRSVPYQLFIPNGATPATPLPLVIHVNGAGQRGANGSGFNDPAKLIAPGAGVGAIVDANKSSVPQAFYLCPMQTGGPDPAGQRYARNFYALALADVLSKYNIDRTRMHLSGYSSGATSMIGFVFRNPRIFASLTLWDAIPGAFNLTNEQDPQSDLLSSAAYPAANFADNTSTPRARAAWAAAVGDIPLNYQHGALDTGSPAGSLSTTQQQNDYVVRGNDPVRNPNINDGAPSWFSSFAANGQTVPTTVAATTNPSPSYPTTNKHVYVPYSSYDHGALNTNCFALNNPWWSWWQARVRSDYT